MGVSLQEGATAACTCVSGLEDKDAEDTLNLLKEAKTGAQDPLKIPVDLGYDVNRKKVGSFRGWTGCLIFSHYFKSPLPVYVKGIFFSFLT